jgi:hypothetical protein
LICEGLNGRLLSICYPTLVTRLFIAARRASSTREGDVSDCNRSLYKSWGPSSLTR